MTADIAGREVELGNGVVVSCKMIKPPDHAWMTATERGIALGGKPVRKLYLGMAGLRDWGALYSEIEIDDMMSNKAAADFQEAMSNQLKEISNVKLL